MYLNVNEARRRLLEAFHPLETSHVSLTEAFGWVLAETVSSDRDMPAFSNSSMDGFALRAEDISPASADTPITLEVVVDIPAGKMSDMKVRSGQSARIMTGAPLPAGADSVVPVEMTDFNNRDAGTAMPRQVKILQSVEVGAYIRPRGQDLQTGQKVLPAGTFLRPQEIGILAMLGFGEVAVYRRPRVGVLSTGDELLPVGAPPEPGKIYESNTHTLSALIEGAGGAVIRLGISPDTADDVQAHLDHAVEKEVDLILTSAGVSVGAFDYVRSVVETYGSLDFWRVNMRPGKPLAFGNYRGTPFIGLPGNPVSAFVGFEVFVRPVMYKMTGIVDWHRVTQRGRIQEAIDSDGRESYLRAVVSPQDGVLQARLTGHQGSGNHFSLVQANAFVVVPAGVKSLSAGAEVEIWLL